MTDHADQETRQDPGTNAEEDRRPTRQPGADPAEAEEIEQERQQRLDPENRPDEVEIDNTDRDFDVTKGMFTDSEGYEKAPERFPDIGEQGA